MRQITVFLFVFILLVLSGCQTGYKDAVKVFVNEGGVFPPELAGRCMSDYGDWEFTFDEQGTITSAMIALGRVNITPGQTTIVPMRMDGEGVYEPDSGQ